MAQQMGDLPTMSITELQALLASLKTERLAAAEALVATKLEDTQRRLDKLLEQDFTIGDTHLQARYTGPCPPTRVRAPLGQWGDRPACGLPLQS